MKKIIKHVWWVGKLIASAYPLIIVIVTLCLMCCGCKSSVKATTETTNVAKTTSGENIRQDMVDSLTKIIAMKDSVYNSLREREKSVSKDSSAMRTFMRNDTVFVESEYWHREYKELARDFEVYQNIENYANELRYSYVCDSVKAFCIDSINNTAVKKETVKEKDGYMDVISKTASIIGYVLAVLSVVIVIMKRR